MFLGIWSYSYIYICIYIFNSIYIYTFIYIFIYISAFISTYIVPVHMYVYIYIYQILAPWYFFFLIPYLIYRRKPGCRATFMSSIILVFGTQMLRFMKQKTVFHMLHGTGICTFKFYLKCCKQCRWIFQSMDPPGNAKMRTANLHAITTKVGYISEQSAYHHGEAGLLHMGNCDIWRLDVDRESKEKTKPCCLGGLYYPVMRGFQ